VSVNYSINENSGPPKSCTLYIWPVTSKRLPTPGLGLQRDDSKELKKRANPFSSIEQNCPKMCTARKCVLEKLKAPKPLPTIASSFKDRSNESTSQSCLR